MRYFIFFICLSFISFASFAEENLKKIDFDYQQSGTTYQLARIAMQDTILPLEENLGRKLIIFTAKEDLNNDKTPEIIAKISDKRFFCDEQSGCKTFIFAISSEGPELIGELAADEIFISQTDNQNVKSLFIKTKYNKNDIYIWDGEKYIKRASEGQS